MEMLCKRRVTNVFGQPLVVLGLPSTALNWIAPV
jgi:hypothetical protein